MQHNPKHVYSEMSLRIELGLLFRNCAKDCSLNLCTIKLYCSYL